MLGVAVLGVLAACSDTASKDFAVDSVAEPVTSVVSTTLAPIVSSTSTSLNHRQTVVGRLPDGTGYVLTFDRPIASGETEGVSAAIVVDIEEDPVAQALMGCSKPCPWPVIGIMGFEKGGSSEGSYESGVYKVSSGDWTMIIRIYDHILDLWGDDTEQTLSDSIQPIHVDGGLPAFDLEPPFRWATDTEIPLQMQAQYQSFVVRRGCGRSNVACSPGMDIQVIPSEAVFAPSPEWDYDVEVQIEVTNP